MCTCHEQLQVNQLLKHTHAHLFILLCITFHNRFYACVYVGIANICRYIFFFVEYLYKVIRWTRLTINNLGWCCQKRHIFSFFVIALSGQTIIYTWLSDRWNVVRSLLYMYAVSSKDNQFFCLHNFFLLHKKSSIFHYQLVHWVFLFRLTSNRLNKCRDCQSL